MGSDERTQAKLNRVGIHDDVTKPIAHANEHFARIAHK